MDKSKMQLVVTPSHREPVSKKVKGSYEGVTVEIKDDLADVLSRRYVGDYTSIRGISINLLKKVIEEYENCQ